MVNKIDANQFGAVKGGSTVNAMFLLVDKLLSSADRGKLSRVFAVDFRKAFERIDHSILISKLYSN